MNWKTSTFENSQPADTDKEHGMCIMNSIPSTLNANEVPRGYHTMSSNDEDPYKKSSNKETNAASVTNISRFSNKLCTINADERDEHHQKGNPFAKSMREFFVHHRFL